MNGTHVHYARSIALQIVKKKIKIKKWQKKFLQSFLCWFLIVTSERNSYLQSYMGRLDDIQTALKPLRNIKKKMK